MNDVRRRKVLYLSGFDPRGSGLYYKMYRDEAAKDQQRSGRELHLSKRRRNGHLSAHWTIDAPDCQTDYEYLAWDDLIRDVWIRSPLGILGRAVGVYYRYFSTGTAKRIRNTARIHFITHVFPLVFLSVIVLLSLGLATAVGTAVHQLLPGWYAAWPATGLTAYTSYLFIGNQLQERFNFYWVLRTYYFFTVLESGHFHALDERVDEFAQHLVEVLNDEQHDEVLLVGHSAGTLLLPMVIERAMQLDTELSRHVDRLALLSLGHCIHDATLLPGAEPLRAAIRATASSPFFWLDVTAPPDGACYPLVDPTQDSGLLPENDSRRRRCISARMHTMLSPQAYRTLKKDPLRLHFQYLLAAEHDTPYNYFDITTGNLSLQQRFDEQSKSPAA